MDIFGGGQKTQELSPVQLQIESVKAKLVAARPELERIAHSTRRSSGLF